MTSNEFRALREALELSPAHLAQLLDCHPSTVHNIESTAYQPERARHTPKRISKQIARLMQVLSDARGRMVLEKIIEGEKKR